jgi:KaiC/GvpD/RAD55 family RecA-like ATPase
MDSEKQKVMLSCMLGNRDLMAMCSGIIKPSYFDPSLKKTVKFMQEYFTKYKDVPKLGAVKAETGITLEDLGKIEKSDMNYVSTEVEEFCRNRAITEAILQGPDLLEKGDFGEILRTLRDAISVGLQRDLGMDYFANPEERMKRTHDTSARISTGIQELDDLIGGGMSRQELLMFAANSGGGKSMNMLNIAKNFLAQGLHGVYISLEMSEDVVSKRLDSMITKIAQENLLRELTKAANLVEKASETYGKFRVKRMPENRTNINTIRSWLQQLEQTEGFVPDFICVDYLDIMGTTMNISLDNLFIKDKYVTEEVRSLGFDYNAIMISASQLGRTAIEADKLNQAHIQGGISKINTADYVIGIKQDDLMKAAGEIYYECLKSRNSSGVGNRALLGWDAISLTVSSLKKKGALVFKPKVNIVLDERQPSTKKADGLSSLMNI